MTNRQDIPVLAESRRLIVKIGSALLVDAETGAVRRDWLDALAADLADLAKGGTRAIVVSSGAIAVGRQHLGLASARLKLEEQQAAAAAGQIHLAHAWQEALAAHGLSAAQVLLTLGDTEERRRHLNARNTIDTLLRLGSVPIINENDTVATEEIRFGDNDRLAARVAQMTGADTLVLLSDIDGLYSADPGTDADARHIPFVPAIAPDIEAMAGPAPAGYSSGGMVTKLEAAKIAVAAGCHMAIADGKAMHPLKAVAEGARCTWFAATDEPRNARKRWIAGAVTAPGELKLDAGALNALYDGKSLLPAGVTAVNGEFDRGDTVILTGPGGEVLGRGLCAYASADAARIAGHKSREIEDILGYRGRDEMIHRDDLVLDRPKQKHAS